MSNDTLTEGDQLLELFTLIHHEFELPCDGIPRVVTCDRAAKWKLLYSCTHTRLLCDEHKNRIFAIRDEPITPEGLKCVQHSPWLPVNILIVEPINGS